MEPPADAGSTHLCDKELPFDAELTGVAKEPRWQSQSRELDRKGGAQRLVHLLIEGCLPSDFVHAAASCPMVFARVLLVVHS